MTTPAPEIVADHPSGAVAEKDAHPARTLASAYSPVDYMSITSFPRLPEDEMVSGENVLKSRKDDDNVLSEQDTGEFARSDTITTNNIFTVSEMRLLSALSVSLQNLLLYLVFFPDPDLFLKSARLQRLPSSASDLASNDIVSLRETTKDPFNEGCACQRDGLTVIITACLTFAVGVTVALIMQIYFGDPQVEVYVCYLQLSICGHVTVAGFCLIDASK